MRGVSEKMNINKMNIELFIMILDLGIIFNGQSHFEVCCIRPID